MPCCTQHMHSSFTTLFWAFFQYFFDFFNSEFCSFSLLPLRPFLLQDLFSVAWLVWHFFSWNSGSPGLIFLLHLLCILCYLTPTSQFFLCTCNTESLSASKLTSWSLPIFRRLLITSFLSIGCIPVAWNPNTKCLLFILPLSNHPFWSHHKLFHLVHHLSNNSIHFFLFVYYHRW